MIAVSTGAAGPAPRPDSNARMIYYRVVEVEWSMQLSVVVPVYSSADCLHELARRVQVEVGSRFESYELILVNDASLDESWKAIAEIVHKLDFVVGMNLRKNVGQDNAIMAGLSAARGDVVIVMDDDLQHDPIDIPRLYETIREGYDVVWANFEEKQQAVWKNVGSKFADRVAVWLLDKPKGLYMSPYKAIRREVVEEILWYDGPFSYVDGIILSLTSNFCQIPATHHPRYAGTGSYDLLRSLGVGLKLATNFSVIPLRLASLTGAIIAIVAMVMGGYFMLERIVSDYDIPGWATLIVTVLFLSGIQLIGIGALGEYIGRMYMTVSRHPQYSIRQVMRPPREPRDRLGDFDPRSRRPGDA